jgi:hypothetical protein
MLGFVSEMCFLKARNSCVLFFHPTYHSISFDWRIKTINLLGYYLKVCSISCHFDDVCFFSNPLLLFYSSSGIYSLLYFPGFIYLPLLCIRFL